MSCLASLLKAKLPLSPLCSPFLCLYTYLFLQSLLYNCPTEGYLWLYTESVHPCIDSNLSPCLCYRPGPILSQNSFHSSVHALTVSDFSVCLYLHVHTLHSAIQEHLSFSYVMDFHSLVHEQTVSAPLEYLIHIYIPSG